MFETLACGLPFMTFVHGIYIYCIHEARLRLLRSTVMLNIKSMISGREDPRDADWH